MSELSGPQQPFPPAVMAAIQQVVGTPNPPPPINPLPPVTDDKARERAINAYVRRIIDLRGKVVAHQFDEVLKLDGLSGEERWLWYQAGPSRDLSRLMEAQQAEELEQAQFAAFAVTQPEQAQLSGPPKPRLRDFERERLQAYIEAQSDPSIIWLEAVARWTPERAAEAAREYARLEKEHA